MPRFDELGLKEFRPSGFNDDRVLLQGFYWESYRHGHAGRPIDYGTKRWYEIVKDNASAIRDGRFDLIWLPPVCFSGDYSAGYNPKQYFNFSNSYGRIYRLLAVMMSFSLTWIMLLGISIACL